jgi:glycosyltransferase involved in cell wall biosynthesis
VKVAGPTVHRAAASRLKVAFVAPAFPRREDPATGIYHYHRAAALAVHADVGVFCLSPSYRPWSTRADPGVTESPVAGARPLAVTRIKYSSLRGLTRAWNPLLAERVLAPALRAFAPDVVLSYWLYPEGQAATRAAHRLGLRAIAGAVGSDLRLAERGAALRRVQRALLDADHVITVSGELRSRAIALGVEVGRVTAVLNGCDSSIFHPAPREDARRALGVPIDAELVLFVGRLVAAKGLRELLGAMKILAPGRKNLRLTILGDGPLGAELRRFVRDSDLARAVSFLGVEEQRGVARWLAASNLLCLPSYSEGCPNVVLEALGCGRPIVATAVGGIPELVDAGCAVLARPRHAALLASALVEGLERDWGLAISPRLRPRSWEDVGTDLYGLCLAAVDRPARSTAATR